jgi:4-amino-4-deoxy-L-arabinose transferase-like glycosyltransferase
MSCGMLKQPDEQDPSHEMKLARGMLASLCCLLPLLIFSFFVKLPDLPIRVWDEARNANTAVEMRLHHNWLVPTYDDRPDMWNTKPPLLIWAQVAAMHLFGIGELAVRLPSAMCALACGLLFWAFCSRHCEKPWSGFFAGAVLATTYPYVFNHAGRTGDYDSPLTLFLTGYSLSAFLYATSGERKWIGVFWLFATLAALTKGVAGMMLFPAVVLFVIIERRFARCLRDPAVYVGGLGFLVAVGGYYLLREHYNPGYWRAVFANEIFGRYVEGLGSARGSFWTYLETILIRDSYWCYFVLPAYLVGILDGSSQIRKVSVFGLIVVVSFWLTISLGQTKLEWYALPLYAFFSLQIGIMLGAGWERLASHVRSRALGRVAAPLIVAVLFYVPFVQVAHYVFKSQEDPWDVELHAQAHFLQQSIREGSDLQNYVFCFRGYNGPANFYVKLLRARGSNVEARDRVRGLAPGMHVVVAQDDVRDELEDVYVVERLGERFGCTSYTVVGVSPEVRNGQLKVLRATYGANCGAPQGNATKAVQRGCDGRSPCNFEVNVGDLGDPVPGCAKEFDVEWQCDDSGDTRAVKVRAEAGFGSVARLKCGPLRTAR